MTNLTMADLDKSYLEFSTDRKLGTLLDPLLKERLGLNGSIFEVHVGKDLYSLHLNVGHDEGGRDLEADGEKLLESMFKLVSAHEGAVSTRDDSALELFFKEKRREAAEKSVALDRIVLGAESRVLALVPEFATSPEADIRLPGKFCGSNSCFSLPPDQFGVVAERLGVEEKYNAITLGYNESIAKVDDGLQALSKVLGPSFPGVRDVDSNNYVPPENPSVDEAASLYFANPISLKYDTGNLMVIRALGVEGKQSKDNPIALFERQAEKILGLPPKAVTAICGGFTGYFGELSVLTFLNLNDMTDWQHFERNKIEKDGKRTVGLYFRQKCFGDSYDNVKLPCYISAQGLTIWGDKNAEIVCAKIEEAMKTSLPPLRDQAPSGKPSFKKIRYGIG